MYPGRLDDRGRLKLPANFLQYFGALGETRLFVTSLDRRIARLYTIPAWRENEKWFFADYREDTKAARNIAFNAADLGAESDIDSQGRILFSTELRRALEIENQPVRLWPIATDRSPERQDLPGTQGRGFREPGGRRSEAGGGGAELMTYALFRNGRRIALAAGGSAGRSLSGRHSRVGGSCGPHRAAADHGTGDCQRPRCAVARTGAAQHGGVGRAHCFHWGPFGKLAEAVAEAGFEKVDGLLADLGVSRYQLTAPERGFSFMADGPLDMRMDQSTGMTAADLVNHTAEKALADLIFQLGEERGARKVARAIVRARPIRSTLHLAGVVERAVPRTGHLHPATRTFMALRMAVNDEPGELDRLLEIGPELLKSGGRMVVISFMSIDDRKVKQKFRALAREGRAVILTKHPLQPSEKRHRKTRLRAAPSCARWKWRRRILSAKRWKKRPQAGEAGGTAPPLHLVDA
jgi:16S rRNA (cytosine(1402)-N(4))-methyltransferase